MTVRLSSADPKARLRPFAGIPAASRRSDAGLNASLRLLGEGSNFKYLTTLRMAGGDRKCALARYRGECPFALGQVICPNPVVGIGPVPDPRSGRGHARKFTGFPRMPI